MDCPASASDSTPPKLIVAPKSVAPRNVNAPPCKIARSQIKSRPWMRPATVESGIDAAASSNIQLASFAGGATTTGLGGGGGLTGCRDWEVPDASCPPVDLKILPWNANSANAAA